MTSHGGAPIGRWAPFTLLAAWSTLWWMALLPAAREGGPIVPFALLVLGGAFALPWVARIGPRAAGIASVIGPMLLASRTVNKGDEDGLWSLIYVMLAGLGLFAAAVAAAAGQRTRAPIGPRSAVAVVAIVAVAATIPVTLLRLPQRAYAARLAPLTAVAERIPVPQGFEDRGTSTAGRPLVDSGDPRAFRTFATTMTFTDACPRFERALRRAGFATISPAGECTFYAADPGVRISAELRAGTTWSEAWVTVEEA